MIALATNVGIEGYTAALVDTPLGKRWLIRSRSVTGARKHIAFTKGGAEAREACALLTTAAEALREASRVLEADKQATRRERKRAVKA